MKPFDVMLVAGEASGDKLASELVPALRAGLINHFSRPTHDLQPCHSPLTPRFFGVGGPHMAGAGVEIIQDTTAHAVFGLSEVIRHLAGFRRLFNRLLDLAEERQPDMIILIDSSGFNSRLAAAIQRRVHARRHRFHNWKPRVVYYVSPQVWASRPGRARQLARDIDLLLCIFPFEPGWYARHTPQLRVEYVGHPLVERYAQSPLNTLRGTQSSAVPLVLILPGSRPQELRHHLPPIMEALQILLLKRAVRIRMILPNQNLHALAHAHASQVHDLEIRIGRLAESLAEADIAIASSGTVTMECAFFAVPTVVVYRVSWSTYLVARHLVRVPFIAMPNLLARAAVYPEFIQGNVTANNIARAALELLMNNRRRVAIQRQLKRVIHSLGPPGACHRAAQAILRLLPNSSTHP